MLVINDDDCCLTQKLRFPIFLADVILLCLPCPIRLLRLCRWRILTPAAFIFTHLIVLMSQSLT